MSSSSRSSAIRWPLRNVRTRLLRVKDSPYFWIFVVAFAIRVAATASFVGISTPPRREAGGLDVLDYEQFAYSMSLGKGYCLSDGQASARRAPGTSLALLPIYVVFGRSYLPAHLWICALSAAACTASAWMAGNAFGSRHSIITGIAMALYPGSIYYSMHFFSEVSFALWLALGCGGTIYALQRPNKWISAVAGLAWGLAILTRPPIILFSQSLP